jgi:hypothetical protein
VCHTASLSPIAYVCGAQLLPFPSYTSTYRAFIWFLHHNRPKVNWSCSCPLAAGRTGCRASVACMLLCAAIDFVCVCVWVACVGCGVVICMCEVCAPTCKVLRPPTLLAGTLPGFFLCGAWSSSDHGRLGSAACMHCLFVCAHNDGHSLCVRVMLTPPPCQKLQGRLQGVGLRVEVHSGRV